MAEWLFETRDSHEREGLEDGNLKLFKDFPLSNLTKETTQNSLDAPRKIEGGKIELRFSLKRIQTADIPGLKNFQEAVKRCLNSEEWLVDDDIKKLKKMDTLLRGKTIPVLEISETGTLGMEGPCAGNTNFFKYMMGKGISGKSGRSRGSHGVGKAAPTINSNLQTIFASSYWKGTQYIMGRATLSSSKGENGKTIHNIGYYGDNYQTVKDVKNLPAWLKRDNPGTSIFVLGFHERSNWESIIAGSTLTYFFSAIERGILEVKIYGKNGSLTYEVKQ